MTFLSYLLVMIFFFFFNLKHINVVSLTHFIVGTAEVFLSSVWLGSVSATVKQKSRSCMMRVRQHGFVSCDARVDSKATYIDKALRMAYYHSYTGSEPESARSD